MLHIIAATQHHVHHGLVGLLIVVTLCAILLSAAGRGCDRG